MKNNLKWEKKLWGPFFPFCKNQWAPFFEAPIFRPLFSRPLFPWPHFSRIPIICPSADFTTVDWLYMSVRDRLQKYTKTQTSGRAYTCGHNNYTRQVQLLSTLPPLQIIFGNHLQLGFHCFWTSNNDRRFYYQLNLNQVLASKISQLLNMYVPSSILFMNALTTFLI